MVGLIDINLGTNVNPISQSVMRGQYLTLAPLLYFEGGVVPDNTSFLGAILPN